MLTTRRRRSTSTSATSLANNNNSTPYRSTTHHYYYELQSGICAFFLAIGSSEGFTQLLKHFVSRKRPNFYQLCGFNTSTLQCEAPYSKVAEAMRSFPSGHTSLSFCGMTFVVWFLLGRVARHQFSSSSTLKVLVYGCMVLPWSYSTYVGATRIVDYWHHVDDVLAGCLLGTTCATVAYHVYHPPVVSRFAGIPWNCGITTTTRSNTNTNSKNNTTTTFLTSSSSTGSSTSMNSISGGGGGGGNDSGVGIAIGSGALKHVGATRIVDYWHHVDDVLAGCLLGTTCATVAYHLYHPPVVSRCAGIPWNGITTTTRSNTNTNSKNTATTTTFLTSSSSTSMNSMGGGGNDTGVGIAIGSGA
eukprot:CAMPEP_0195306010 /NCGR_PEP_ID=MMETSP0707-20130614/36983_1 /TAXON_ID=33640 /ORGANISM="Asterionellopsis glacialis, Strain CCMP134" /LENGTH=358 /DNA_ID=CAMNT_0040370219 /DNA_START=115 /DNA_END=1190 /DNA_ORIENTATION=-